MKKSNIIITIKFIVLLMLVVVSLITYVIYAKNDFDTNTIREWISSYGAVAWLVTLLFTIVVSSLGLLIIIPILVTALFFNMVASSLILWFGLNIGASFSFFISRWLGREYVEKKFVNKGKLLKSFDQKLFKHGFYTVLIARLIFFIPFEFVNLVCGVSKIKFKDYLFATILGMTPGMILMIYVIQKINYPYTPQFVIASVMFLLLTIIPLLSSKIRKAVF